MASGDKFDVDMFHKSIQYALEKLGKSKSGFERTVVSKFKRKRRVGSGNELVDYSRAPCLGTDQKARGLWERDCPLTSSPQLIFVTCLLRELCPLIFATQDKNCIYRNQELPEK